MKWNVAHVAPCRVILIIVCLKPDFTGFYPPPNTWYKIKRFLVPNTMAESNQTEVDLKLKEMTHHSGRRIRPLINARNTI